jgi:hypothetical protein
MVMYLKENVIKAIDNLSEEQQRRLLDWIQTLQRERTKPPTGRLGLKKLFQREEFYEDVLSHRL